MTELLWVLAGIVIGGGLVAGRRWTTLDAARFEADANWNRYVESERQRNNMRRDLEAAQRRNKHLEAERDTAAYQLTQLAAVAQVATQQAQAGRGYVIGESALARVSVN